MVFFILFRYSISVRFQVESLVYGMKCFILSFLATTSVLMGVHSSRSYSYLYPVERFTHDGQEYLMSLWQKEKDCVELYLCNTATGVAQKELFSLFNPVGIQLLPSHDAYSFIDNGRVRIKEFIKRSPQSLEFDKPIFNISLVHWIDDTMAYCHAQEGHRFGIYMFDRNGSVQRLLYDASADYLFPSKIGDMLHYIRRTQVNDSMHYEVGVVPFPDKVLCDERVLYNLEDQQLILSAGTLPIAFLRMESAQQGFVLVHQNEFDPEVDRTIQFHYYALERRSNGWHARQLFSFCVPSCLLDHTNQNRLYENVLPLLPYHHGANIYYGSMSSDTASENMQLYCFNMKNQTIRWCPIAGSRPPLLFSPRACGRGIACGGSIASNVHDFVPSVYVKDDFVMFNFAWLRR